MPPEQGLAYGIVQGVTEFLPISSSAHLVLLPWFLDWDDPGLGFDVALHLGTLAAIIWYFGGEWRRLFARTIAGLRDGRPAGSGEARLFWKIVLASIPAMLAGLFFQHWAETTFRSPPVVATALASLAILLYWSDRRPQSRAGTDEVGWFEALWIGAAQALAIVPGVSRSGVTITAARCLSLDRETAARFSFLLSMPVVAGATLFEARSLAAMAADAGAMLALAAATLSGFAAIAGLLRYVRFRSYTPFVVYRLGLAAAIVAS